MQSKPLSGAEIVVKALRELNIDVVFGYSGSYAMPIIEAIHRAGVRFVQPTSEGAAVHAADGYFRASGRVAAVLTTSGPGATNLVTGIATAYMDSVPIMILTANVPTFKLGKDSFQEVDITGIVTPVTKYAHIIKSASELEPELKKAYALAVSGRTSPVLIDIPFDVLKEESDYLGTALPKYPKPVLETSAVEEAARLINSSRHPGILAGGGCSGAEEAIRVLSEKACMPIFTSLRGISSGYGKNLVGAIGSSAPASFNRAYNKCDLILALGTRFSDRMYSKPTNKKFIHVDSDAAEIDKVVSTALGINCDVTDAVTALTPLVYERDERVEIPSSPKKSPGLSRLAASVLAGAEEGTIFATDVGSHQLRFLHAVREIAKNELITSLGLGTMGFGLPSLIGACLATGKRGILVTGDGSFNMNFNELATAKKLGLDVTVVIGNNFSLGMISDLERSEGERDALSDAIETPQINYSALARAFGANGKRVPLGRLKEELELRPSGLNVFDVHIKG